MAVTVTVYTRDECPLCEDVLDAVARVAADVPIERRVVNVDDDAELREEYGERVPYVFVDGVPKFKYRVNEAALREAVDAARD